MRKLLINIQPTIFNYSGYIIDSSGEFKQVTTIPFNPFDIVTYAKTNDINAIILKGPRCYIEGIQKQLQTKTTMPIELYEEDK